MTAPLTRVRARGPWFVDEHGRVVILRGVNLGGDCKVPYPDGGTQHRTDFADHRDVSFVGRPFPLDEADEHLDRLRRWGFGCLRLLTTWEAVEHAGPGRYDEEYLDFYAELCRRAGEKGFYVFVDFHQDVWSRMTGGDGAPGWVFEALGMDLAALSAADAALVMQHAYDYDDPRGRQEDNYPTMCWSRNYRYPANGILWTLFFGGRDFAPGFEVDGRNVQDFLQGHYLACQRAVAERVADLPHVLGFDTLNEPWKGWIGTALSDRPVHVLREDPALPGLAWSPLDALAAASGQPVRLRDLGTAALAANSLTLGRAGAGRRVVVNPEGRSIWLPGAEDPFRREGVWEPGDGGPRVLREDHFRQVGDRRVSFNRDHLAPFWKRVAETMRSVRDDWVLFAEKDAMDAFGNPTFPAEVPPNTANATHWYDVVMLGLKRYPYPVNGDVLARKPVVGKRGIRGMYVRQLGRVRNASRKVGTDGGIPTLIGEFGIPYDLNGGEAYRRWAQGDRSDRPWRMHALALELMYDAMDELLLSSTQWNYTASNRNDLRVGDGWNQEDLSIFSEDQRPDPADPDGGARGLLGFLRPYARAIQGTPRSVRFRSSTGELRLVYDADPSIPAPTELFVPARRYPSGFDVDAPGSEVRLLPEEQRVEVRAREPGPRTIVIRRR